MSTKIKTVAAVGSDPSLHIPPHGGILVDRELVGAAREEALHEAVSAPRLLLQDFEVSDLEMIASGALSPLTGFMGREDFQSVLERARLANGLVWSIPIVLARPAREADRLRLGKAAALTTSEGTVLALLRVKELYPHDREAHVQAVFGTEDPAHPGVARVMERMGEVAIAGEIFLLRPVPHQDFLEHRLAPRDTRALFQARGWRSVAAFQTRNPIHRAHEYLTKVALEVVDGLLVHPLIGETKPGDTPAEVRMQCYRTLLENYYPADRTVLAVFPAAMRYAGPREAVFHAIARKNYGVTHFIVGRDHAGVNRPDGKPYYGTYEAQEYIARFSREELGIEIFRFENTFFDRRTGGMVSEKTKPRAAEPVIVSGTRLREMLRSGEVPPEEITRPEVARILIEHATNGNGNGNGNGKAHAALLPSPIFPPARREVPVTKEIRGFTLWFTGLSGAGKSTLSRRIEEVLRSRGRRVEVLDGDEVRENLSKGLGFSREDRDTNIRRIGYVCHLLSRNGVIAISAAISPFRSIRDENRQRIGTFAEVFVKCPLEILIERDVKGLYKKALAGEIKDFTGISHPYEDPLHPEVVVETDKESVEESAERIVRYLEGNRWL
jgi:sulfate adenylyltransferase